MTTVRKETEKLLDGNELILEVVEDNPASNRVTLTLVSKGDQGEIALGRANLGTVFRKQSRFAAESLVDALQSYLAREAETAATPTLEAQIKAKAEGKAPVAMPTPVKQRSGLPTQGQSIELDHLTRRDLAAQLRQLADSIEVNDPKIVITALDIQPIRGGGQSFVINLTRKP